MKMRQYLAGDGQAGEAVEAAADDVPVMVVKAEQGLYTVGKLRLPAHGEEEAVHDEDDGTRRSVMAVCSFMVMDASVRA